MSITRARNALLSRGAFAIALLLCCADVSWAQRVPPAEPSTLDLEQLMKVEVVFAASKRAQNSREVPSFVSVVTAADIKEHGHRTLADVLKTLPSFYVSNDRNYSFIGVRGFSLPGDYSSRILLLLNGLRTNDNIYDQAYIGEEFIVDVDLIERIEVIRGPSAALYGSNAFFAVINVVTKQGQSLKGGEVATTAASYGTYAGRLSYGRTFANDVDVIVSASLSDSKGQNLYFPEFDDPSTNNGIAVDADRESSRKLFASMSKGGFSLQTSNFLRRKGIPTASYGMVFNDNRAKTVDAMTLASLAYTRAFAKGASLSTRLHAGRSTYVGDYAYGGLPNKDDNVGEWWGIDVDASRAFLARHFITAGVELRDNVRQDQKNFDQEPFVSYTDMRNQAVRWGVFAQDEIKLFDPLLLYAGVRYDHYETFGSATSPRVGLIYTPGAATTVKLLAGRAFRAPNEYEMFLENDLYRSNPLLQPERIETLELVAQRLIGGGVQISASTFRNEMSALVSQRVDTNDNNRLVFENAGEIDSKGVELGVKVNRGHGLSGELTYALQRTESRASRLELANSPRHMAKLYLLAPLGADLTAGVDAQYLSNRKTLTGGNAPAYLLTNFSLLAPRVFGRFDVSATLYNLFDTRYGNPGSQEHIQDVIQQDRRNFRVKTTLHY
jgi:outer membrane receptor for ferrienterochelin and colicin